jgi:hypothetical protein
MKKILFNAFNGNSALMGTALRGTTAGNIVSSGNSNRVTKRQRMQSARTLGASVINNTAMFVVAAALLSVGAANASPIAVTSNADAGDNTLRAAITAAQDGDVITVQAGLGTIVLTESLPAIAVGLTIEGNGVTIDGSSLGFTLLLINTDGEVPITINRVHFTNGGGTEYLIGAAISDEGSGCTLTVTSCIFTNNVTGGGTGAAICNNFGSGIFNISGSTFYKNRADGGGEGIIYALGATVTLTGNIFYENYTSWDAIVPLYGEITSSYNVYDDLGNESDPETTYQFGGDGDTEFLELELDDIFLPNITEVTLPNPLPDGYPVKDFYGTAIIPGSIVGAVVGVPSAKPALASLSVSAGSIDFDSDTKVYDVTVAPDVESITITAAAAKGSVITPADTAGVKTLADGANAFLIHVNKTDEPETVVYTLNVYRQSTSADLKSLTVTGATLSPDFHPDTLVYTANVASGTTSITINATPVAARAYPEGAGILSISGDTTVKIVVFSEVGGAEKTYTIHVKQGATGVLMSRAALSVHPNPTDGVVYIDNPDGAEVTVYTVSGAVVVRTTADVIDLSDYPAGVYVITVGGKVAKVVKR